MGGATEGNANQTQPNRILSVIIPVRNHARPLKRLLDNLARQKIPAGWTVEVIAVDNGSTDNTAEIIRASGVRYARCSELGPGPARNRGVELARGKLLYFIDADACPVNDDHYVRILASTQRLLREGAFGALGGAILPPRHQLWNPIAIGDHWACWFNWHPKRSPQRTKLFQPGISLVMLRGVFEANRWIRCAGSGHAGHGNTAPPYEARVANLFSSRNYRYA
ncbi:MAG: glycosyltransferase family 2 protein [Alphaproteobacteria bacterium]